MLPTDPDIKSYRLMYNNIGVNFHETVPLKEYIGEFELFGVMARVTSKGRCHEIIKNRSDLYCKGYFSQKILPVIYLYIICTSAVLYLKKFKNDCRI